MEKIAWPDEIGGEILPDAPDKQPQQLRGPELNAYIMKLFKEMCPSTVARHLGENNLEIKRGLELRLRYMKGGQVKIPNFDMTRQQSLSGFYIQMYGEEQKGDDICGRCAKNKGNLVGCYVLEGFAKGACGNCLSGSGGSVCSLADCTPAPRKRKGSVLGGSLSKRPREDDDEAALDGIPSKHLETFANFLYSVVERRSRSKPLYPSVLYYTCFFSFLFTF
ncbi:hypothetical protein SODALDRAFT_374365 [Sodiomyces alkalinus F11]|uniref:Uncharacterized protein n=1 Tax=Sodiomyces alkalinus (strain CBS 110278 / VKM F-3762 / F11) TaxID=1314773 RepID=A0A3N2Q5D6_SODAK|nr:hypothetical protein SODALDRAFT_374365 [Sodiomyces alkalinus F11]ROT41981.1 hypothetical protein SODALDRAFT_374365 [Sodiomyces alkalinus F11]